jgi:hypothetical protein
MYLGLIYCFQVYQAIKKKKLLPVYNQGTDPLVVDWASQQQDVVLSAATIQVDTTMHTFFSGQVFQDNQHRL